MKLEKFKNQNKNELSMIEVAYEILNENKKEAMNFSDIVNELQTYLGKSDDEIKAYLPQFYTDMNNDGSFLSLGENVWGLRKWYPFDSVDEEVNHPEDNGTENTHKAAQKVNAFLSDDEEDDDVVDYDDDADLDVNDMDDDEESGEDNGPDLSKFTNTDLSVDDDDDDDAEDTGLDDGIEGQLTEFDADDDDTDIDLSDEDDDDYEDDDDADDSDSDDNK